MSSQLQTQLLPAFILHTRAYRETSLICEVFTQSEGRLSLIAKGAKRGKSSKSTILQAFYPLLISWRGKSELQTLLQVECDGPVYPLRGSCLFAGLYINELLMRLLHKHDPHPDLFDAYQALLQVLDQSQLEKQLRTFELTLLSAVGYGLTVDHIQSDRYYLFSIDNGFTLSQSKPLSADVFLGADIMAIAAAHFSDDKILVVAKQLMRVIFKRLLQGKPLNARHLFV